MKGGSILASDALEKSKKKRREKADEKLPKATKAVTSAENKAKKILHERGVQARKDEKPRRLFIQQSQALRAFIPSNT
jgi:cellobiose-specific phosphotransferase system component IIA